MSISEIRKDETFEKEIKWLEFLVGEGEELKLILTKDAKETEIFFYRGAPDKQLRFKAEYVEAMI